MMRFLLKKLLSYFPQDTEKPKLVKAYRRTGFQPDIFMLRTEQNMSDDEWIYEIVPHEQIESMQDKAEQIKRNMDEGVSIVLTADNQSAIEMCQCWRKSMKGDIEAAFKIASFMSSIISTIENHLMEEGINPYED